MSAIAGYVAWREALSPADACRLMAGPLRTFGPERSNTSSLGRAAFSHHLRKLLIEDDADAQPLLRGDRLLLTCDVRLDNRTELMAVMGLDPRPEIVDSDLVLEAWLRWGALAPAKLAGDFAIAVWDAGEESLTLARSPFAFRPLYYTSNSAFAAFASAPSALRELPGVPAEPNLEFLSDVIAERYPADGSTPYRGISKVLHGRMVKITREGIAISQFWDVRPRPVKFRDRRDYGLAMREHLERAVEVRLRRRQGGIGSQLSSGRDSAAVTATTALLVAPEEMMAFTGAPRPGYPEFEGPRVISDESRFAAEVAAAHPNVRHVVCRRDFRSLFALTGECHRVHQEPLPNFLNLPWWCSIGRHANLSGASVLMSGLAGNITISASADRHLVDLVRSGRLFHWWRVSRFLRREGHAGWPYLLRASFGPWIPARVHNGLLRATGRDFMFHKDVPLLRDSHRRSARTRLAEQILDIRPPKSFFAHRRQMLLDWAHHDKLSTVQWGIELRDPTADPNLIDFCLSLPVEVLTSADSSRPVYDDAFADRVPASIRNSTARGYQGADWHELVTSEELLALVRHYWQSPIVAELLDEEAVAALARRWPRSAPDDENAAVPFRNQLMAAMGIANFIAVTFDGMPPVPEAERAS